MRDGPGSDDDGPTTDGCPGGLWAVGEGERSPTRFLVPTRSTVSSPERWSEWFDGEGFLMRPKTPSPVRRGFGVDKRCPLFFPKYPISPDPVQFQQAAPEPKSG